MLDVVVVAAGAGEGDAGVVVCANAAPPASEVPSKAAATYFLIIGFSFQQID
jgi:hypothetical protein